MKSQTLVRLESTVHRPKIILIAIITCSIFLFSSCDQRQNDASDLGHLTGKISIGPLCPVETIPPDPNCQPTEATYKAWPIGVWTSDKKSKMATLQPNLDGSYDFELQTGSYVVDLEVQHLFGANLPATITIVTAGTTVLDIEIDTGIR